MTDAAQPVVHNAWLFRARRRGGHVHVDVWAGTPAQAAQQARPKLGSLVMDPAQWDELVDPVASAGLFPLAEFETILDPSETDDA